MVIGEESFRTINCLPFALPGQPYSGAGILNFVFGEMWLRPGLGLKERRLVTVACVAFQDAPLPILSHVYAAPEEPRCLVRGDGGAGIAVRRVLRLAEGVTSQPGDR